MAAINMTSKKTILHIINYLGRGGAEVMLVQLLKELKEYNNIVVTLNDKNHFTKEEFVCDGYYSLHMGRFANFPIAAWHLKQFIKKQEIHLVHSHLFDATLVARLGLPRHIPLITTIHTNVTASAEYKKWYMLLLEKVSYRLHKSTIIGVSTSMLQQYFTHFNHKPYKKHLLYTFANVAENVVTTAQPAADDGVFKLVAIGALRYPKNQQYLIKAFEQIKDMPVTLDIYGAGADEQLLKNMVATAGVKIFFKGEIKHAAQLLPDYDAYVMSSIFEGFSLSVLEAMAMAMPMLLSDIPSFKEQCEETALYFDLNNTADFVAQLKLLMTDADLRQKLSSTAKQRMLANFTMQHHLNGLRKIYTETMASN
jgi:L-malate glycosyltransferase